MADSHNNPAPSSNFTIPNPTRKPIVIKNPFGELGEVLDFAKQKAASPPVAPSGATDAVLKPSDPVPDGARQVEGIDFNKYRDQPITVEELVAGMSSMGFQATSVGEAVRIINDMVSHFSQLNRVWLSDPTCRVGVRV